MRRRQFDRRRTTGYVRPSCRLIERVKSACRVHERSTRVDADRDTEGFGDFLLAGAELLRCRAVNGDTTVAAQADRDRKCDKLPSLGIKVSRLRAGAAERGIALDSIAESLPISPTRARIWFR